MQSMLDHIAFYLSYSSASTVPVTETISIHAGTSAASCAYFSQGAFSGSVFGVFGGWALYQLVQLACGWETGGVVMWIHHLLFAFIGIAVPYLFVLPELTMFCTCNGDLNAFPGADARLSRDRRT